MKKFTLSVALSLFVLITFGQIVKQGNSWNYVRIDYMTGINCLKSTNCSGFALWNYQYDIDKDTLINDTIYNIVRLKITTVYSSQNYIAGYLKTDSSGKKKLW